MEMSHDRLPTDSPRSHHVYGGWKKQQQHAMPQSLSHAFVWCTWIWFSWSLTFIFAIQIILFKVF